VALAACTRNPATGRNQLLLISHDQAAAMGAAARGELITQYGGEMGPAALRAYVDRVGQMLATAAADPRTRFSFTVLDSDVLNAFSLPDGSVFLTRGLLQRFSDEAQVAGVLGHEIGHVTGQHVREQISRQLLAAGLLAGLGAATESDWAVAGASLFAGGYLLHFGRDQEHEADAQGVRYMVAAGYDPGGMLAVLTILGQSAGTRVPEILSTHPDPLNRADRVRSLIHQSYPYTQGNPGFGTYRERFQRQAAPYLGVDTAGPAAQGGWCLVCAARGP
jgi:predicted Zn-dependent protease